MATTKELADRIAPKIESRIARSRAARLDREAEEELWASMLDAEVNPDQNVKRVRLALANIDTYTQEIDQVLRQLNQEVLQEKAYLSPWGRSYQTTYTEDMKPVCGCDSIHILLSWGGFCDQIRGQTQGLQTSSTVNLRASLPSSSTPLRLYGNKIAQP